MSIAPLDLAKLKGVDLFAHLISIVIDEDADIRGFQRRLVERGIQLAPSDDALAKADVYFAIRRLLERIVELGGTDKTIRDLTITVRRALEEAANMRGQNGRAEDTTSDITGLSDEDPGPGP